MSTLNEGKNNINRSQWDFGSFGDTRRMELTKQLFNNEGYIPRGVSFRNIDEAMKKWVEDEIDLTFDGAKLPTMLLLATQRINEFGQNWQFNKEGGLLLNFKTLTRNINVQHGTQYDKAAIPPTTWFTVGYVDVIENGIQSKDVIEMLEPIQTDITYTVSLFSTNFSLLNDYSTILHNKFKSIQEYINVNNGHWMSIELTNVSDQSQYDLQDRRFFSLSYDILCKGYLIPEEHFRRTRLTTRMVVAIDATMRDRPEVTIEEVPFHDQINLNLRINFEVGTRDLAQFRLDQQMLVTSVHTSNIKKYQLKRDNEIYFTPTCSNFELREFERIYLNIKREDPIKPAWIEFRGHSIPNPKWL